MMEISATKQNDRSVFFKRHHEDKLMPCASNIEDNNTFHMGVLFDGEANKVPNRSEDVEVNMTNCTKSIDHVLVEDDCKDPTENSSSFGDTVSGSENGSRMDGDGVEEVDSTFCGGDGSSSVFDGALPMRNKRLSDHWRRFVRPIVWRCKWAELQIKQLQSHALKYDRELAIYDQRKQFESEKSTSEGYDAKSQPFSCQNGRNQVVKRKKRKRVEETTDLASYMSHHNLFSYYEYKRSAVDGVFVDNDGGNLDNKTINRNDNFEFEDRWTSLELREGDNSLEQILWKIEVAQSEVHKLKTRIDMVVSENPGKFTSVNNLSLLVPCDALTNSDRATSPPKNVNGMPDRSLSILFQHTSECDMRDLFMPESAASRHREATLFPDMIESIGLPQVGVSCENTYPDVPPFDFDVNDAKLESSVEEVIVSDEELQNFERVISRFTERKPLEPLSKMESLPLVTAPEADLPVKMYVPDGQPSSSKANVRNNKRKWGRQKSHTGKWSRRSSG
ncbi:hypothetical protein EZV62_013906 [Acer yangbiense]|uniref:Uncharacterized protein n=1 Tax=Acer yangbiense TaxID=1000413 RepID=A0A5C7HQJ5_9ROSI|nr:hypothetical protein EZV62_013906 [Acer yangbiense]